MEQIGHQRRSPHGKSAQAKMLNTVSHQGTANYDPQDRFTHPLKTGRNKRLVIPRTDKDVGQELSLPTRGRPAGTPAPAGGRQAGTATVETSLSASHEACTHNTPTQPPFGQVLSTEGHRGPHWRPTRRFAANLR